MGNKGVRCCLAIGVFLLMVVWIPLGAQASQLKSVGRGNAGTIWNGVSSVGVTPGEESDAIQILFIGNSLTGRNNMPAIFQKLAAAGGYEVYVEWIWEGGCTLARYANRQTAEGAIVYRKLRSRKWDYVVIQEQSRKPLLYPSAVKKSVTTLSKTIKRLGAEPILFMTWAHKKGASFYQTSFAKRKGIDQKKYQTKVASLYNEMGSENDIAVAKVGVAFWRCCQYWQSIALYRSDKLHPTTAGSYLAACTFYATIFQEKLPEENLGVSKSTAVTLRRVAEKVTFTSSGNL